MDPIVLRRLRDVPSLLERLPFDPEFSFSDVYLHRTHTSTLLYDLVTRQGIDNMIEKVVKLGSETVLRKGESYMADVQLWFRQLGALVCDEVWDGLTPLQQIELASLRGEYLFFLNVPEPVQPLGAGGGRLDPLRWNIPTIGHGVLRDKLLSALENQRPTLEGLMCKTVAKVRFA